jgi:hypothetical protein
LTDFDYDTLSLSGNWLSWYNLIMLLNFECLRLCYIFCIIHHVIIICGVSVGFTSPSEPMHHPFGNDTSHIKLWGASFQNCPTYFGQPKDYYQRVLSGYASSCVSFIHGFGSVTLLFSVTPILGVWLKNSRVMLPKSWTEDTWELV